MQVDVDNPFVQKFAESAEQNNGMFAGVVVVALQNITECRSRFSMHQISIHGSLESLKLSLVPGHKYLGILNICTDLQAGTFKMGRMKLRRVVDNNEFRNAIAFPMVPDGRELS